MKKKFIKQSLDIRDLSIGDIITHTDDYGISDDDPLYVIVDIEYYTRRGTKYANLRTIPPCLSEATGLSCGSSIEIYCIRMVKKNK